MARIALLIRAAGGKMRALVGKIAVVGVIAVGIYLSLVMLDITCPEGLKSCELYEPFSPW